MISPINFPVPHPDSEKLKSEVARLRTELSMLVLERDDLLYQQCRSIEAEYMLAFGALQYKVYETECAILRAKRKIELIQAQINRQQNPDLAEIEKTLEEEFAAYTARLEAEIEKMDAVVKRRRHSRPLSGDETQEVKKLYRAIVKKLHPDLNPSLSEAKRNLFKTAVEAFGRGDLDELHIIHAMIAGGDAADVPAGDENSLVAERERLGVLLTRVREDIAEIKASYPYTLKELVQSQEKIAARQAELETRIAELQGVLAVYNGRMKEMLR